MPMKTIISTMTLAILVIYSTSPAEADLTAILSQQLQATLAADSSTPIPVIVTLMTDEAPQMLAKRLGPRERSRLVRELKSESETRLKPLHHLLTQRNIKSARPLWLIGGFALSASPDLIVELAVNPRVQAITLDTEIKLPQLPDAIDATLEWNIDRTGAPYLWQRGYDGTSITIAILDSGVSIDHPDLAERWRGLPGDWFDPYNNSSTPYDFGSFHGTAVASVALGGDNSGSSIGMAPGANLIVAKIFRDDGTANISYIIEALQWVLNPGGDPNRAPAIVNNSWGFEEEEGACLSSFGSGNSAYHLRAAIQTIKQAGIFVVAAAGNKGPGAATSTSPSNYPESFSVGATGYDNIIADFSSRGPSACPEDTFYPDLVAPGMMIKVATTHNDGSNGYRWVAGTSFSAAHVSGAVALLSSARKDLSARTLELALTHAARDLGAAGIDTTYGHGLLDVADALDLIENNLLPTLIDNNPPNPPPIVAPTDGSIFSTQDTITLTWNEATDPDGDDISYRVVVADNPDLNNPLQLNSDIPTSALLGLAMLGLGATLRKKRVSVLILLFVSALWINSCGGGNSGDKASTNYNYSQTIGPLSAGTYYWKVVANDGRGGISESRVASFKVE